MHLTDVYTVISIIVVIISIVSHRDTAEECDAVVFAEVLHAV